MLLVVLFALFALLGSSRGEYFVPQGVFGYYVGGSYQGPDVAGRRSPVPVGGNSDVSSGDLATIIERVNQSLRRMKTVSEEAHKAQKEMEELMKILLETAGRVREEDGKDPESADSSNEVIASEDTSIDKTTGAESLPTEAGTTEQDLPNPIHRTSAEISLPTEAQPDVTTAEEDLPDVDESSDVTTTEDVLPYTDSGISSDVTTEPEIDVMPDERTDPPINRPTESDYTTVPSDRTETIVKDHESQTFCGHEFEEEQIPGNPQSTCAGWLLENYHRFKRGWKSCQEVDTSDVLDLQTCNQFDRECQRTDSNEACCKKVVCNLQKTSRLYMSDDEGPGDLATTACMDRSHDRLDNSCVKWMYQFYHVTKQSEGWRKCSAFDYSRHSRVSCSKLKKKCQKADRKGQKALANEYCCASVHCYGRRRHFLRLSG